MSDKATADLIRQLTDKINEYDHYYHNLNTSLISDADYDQLLQKLIRMEEQFPHLKCEDSPTNRVAPSPASLLTKVKYEHPMISLGKCFSDDDLKNFFYRYTTMFGSAAEYSVEPKLDGLAIRLVYVRGVLKEATTRGDGRVGEDVLRNIARVSNVEYKLKGKGWPPRLEVRGECVAILAEFDKLNKQLENIGQKPYANPRNFVSGNLRQGDPTKVHGYAIMFLAYEVVEAEQFAGTHAIAMYRLHQWGILPVASQVYKTFEDAWKEVVRFQEWRPTYFCDIDGAVIKLTDYGLRQAVGGTDHHPRWAIAFKYPPETANTLVKSIELTVGRTGVITPVAKINPVKIGGVMVSSANLKNFEVIKRLGIAEGDLVCVARGGDVIPDIKSVVKKHSKFKHFAVPVSCPNCNAELQQSGLELYCPNKTGCDIQAIKHLIYFVSRDCANINLLGEVYIKQLYDKGWVKTTSDLYHLSEEVLKNELGDKVGGKVYANIQKAKGFSLDKFIQCLGIPGIGEGTASAIATHFKTLESLEDAQPTDIWEAPDVGEGTAKALYAFLTDARSRKELNRLVEAGVTTGLAEKPNEGPLTGEVWCITGTFRNMKRKEIADYLKLQGAEVVDSVTKKTTHLLMGENPGAKLDQAIKYNCVIIDDANFTKL